MCITDYTKLFFNRMWKPGTVSCNGQHQSLNTNLEDKHKNQPRTDACFRTPQAAQVPRTQEGALHQGDHFENQRSKSHAFNPSIPVPWVKKDGDRYGNLQSILQIGDETVELEDLIRAFDQDVVRSGEQYQNVIRKPLKPTTLNVFLVSMHDLSTAMHFDRVKGISVLTMNRTTNQLYTALELKITRRFSNPIDNGN